MATQTEEPTPQDNAPSVVATVTTDEGEAELATDSSEVNAEVSEEPKPEAVEDIAVGWEEVKDPNTGNSYYFNKETQETSWAKPIATQAEEPTPQDDAPLDAATSTTDGGETEPAADSSEVTTEASEEPKPEAVECIAVGWEEVKDPNTGNSYYFNKETQETSWVKPIATQTQEPIPQDDAPSATPQANDWVETLDPSSGKNYYYNATTGEVSWEKPAAFQAPEDLVPVTTASETEQPDSVSAEDAFAKPATDPAPAGETIVNVQHSSPLAKTHERRLSAEEMFASPPEKIRSGESPLSGGVATAAEDLFGANGADSSTTKISEATTTTNVSETQGPVAASPGAFGPPGNNGTTTAEDLFGVNPAPTSSEPPTSGATDVVAAPTSQGSAVMQGFSPPPPLATTAEDLFGAVPAPSITRAKSTPPEPPSETEDEDEMREIPLTPDASLLIKTAASNNMPSLPNATEAAPAPVTAATTGEDLFAAIGMPPPPFQSRR